MRSVLTLSIAGVLFASTAVALAHNTRWAWTESKANQMVARDTRVRLPAAERASLERELADAVRLYGGLVLAAGEVGDPIASGIFQNLLYRYSRALQTVRGGLKADAVACKGSGAAVQGRRFKHFRCTVTSEALEIPTAVLNPPAETAQLPTVVEGQPRIIPPLEARLAVHVTGRSTMASYRIA